MKSSSTLKLVIVGGGYAGLSALITFREYASHAHIILIDPRPHHLIITRLHESVRRPLESIQIPFSNLAKRFNFRHIQSYIELNQDILSEWDRQKSLNVEGEIIYFDYILIATGAISFDSDISPNVHDLNSLSRNSFAKTLQKLISDTGLQEPKINIIGAGPTGIQFSFEIANVLLKCHRTFRLNLIDSNEKLLSRFPTQISAYVEQKLSMKQIHIKNSQYYKGVKNNQILLQNTNTGIESKMVSDLTLLLIGNKSKLILHANLFGQVKLDNIILNHVYTAGDCSHFDQIGSNSLTSQSAIRKGKATAKNILSKAGVIGFCLPYMHKDMGYLLSLGPNDAIGWIGNKSAIIKGLPAFIAKEAIETRYNHRLLEFNSYFF